MRFVSRRDLILACCAIAVLAGCGSGHTSPRPAGAGAPPAMLRLHTIGSFDNPVYATALPGANGIAVVEQSGRVVAMTGSSRRVLVDVKSRISFGGERGLLGLAFSPDGSRMYLNYTDIHGDTNVVEAPVPPRGASPVTRPARTLLTVHQPYSNHNGGMLAFGPDGMLYVGMGDGGSAGDPQHHAQDPHSRLGKLLRINTTSGAISTVASGLRNPWRFSFDAHERMIWIGDVGQNAWEEVDSVGLDQLDHTNFGWNGWEGSARYTDGVSVPSAAVTFPVITYPHSEGCSVTGGYVYRGSAIPSLRGWYIFADYCSNWIRMVRASAAHHGASQESQLQPRQVPSTRGIVSFGEDRQHELLVCVASTGKVYRIEGA